MPLPLAVQESRDRDVELLLAAGADPSVQSSSGWTGVMYAARNGHMPLLKKLIGKGGGELVFNKDTVSSGSPSFALLSNFMLRDRNHASRRACPEL